jgi:hypothetical protein
MPPLPVRVSLPVNGDGLDDLIVGAKYADLSDKLNTGKSYIIFGKTDTNAVNLIKLGDNSQYANNIRFTCSRLATWGTPGAYNQIIQAIAVDIACTGD